MSKSKKGSKMPNSEFGSKRPGKLLSGNVGKKMTKDRERMKNKELVFKEKKDNQV